MSAFDPAESSIDSWIAPKQAYSTLMSDPTGLFDPRKSTRRFRITRQRPWTSSIADIFITSLVLAGFCPRHSPRSQTFDTEQIPSSEYRAPHFRIPLLNFQGQTSVKSSSTFLPLRLDSQHRNLPHHRRAYSTNAVAKKGLISKDHDSSQSRLAAVSALDDHWLSPTSDESARIEICQHLSGRHGPPLHLQQDYAGKSGPVFYGDAQKGASSNTTQPPGTQYFEEEKIDSAARSDISLEMKNQRLKSGVTVCGEPPPPTSSAMSEHGVMGTVENTEREDIALYIYDETRSNQYVFQLYRKLPAPGVLHLSSKDRMALLRRFANPRDRRWINARRYLALVRDMTIAKLPLPLSLWTSAIYLTGHATGRVFKSDLKAALGLWQRMEHVEGIKSDGVVFAALFDIAIKSGQYMVADQLLEEMNQRGIELSRCGMVSLIHFYGFKGDVSGIRKTFDEFVDSGHLVDTVVLNCLLVAFLRSGELETAEQIYCHMMDAQRSLRQMLHDRSNHFPHNPSLSEDFFTYRKKNRDNLKFLARAVSLKHDSPVEHKLLQAAVPLSPDTRTFHIFLSHHSYKTGNFEKFTDILRDIENTYVTPPLAMTFLFLFEGFARHGGRPKTQWTAQKLFLIWEDFRQALYDSKRRYNERFHLRKELSIEKSSTKQANFQEIPTVSTMYMRLPSRSTLDSRPSVECDTSLLGDLQQEEEYGDKDLKYFLDDQEIGNDLEDPFRVTTDLEHELQQIERRIENGVFLGRRIIISILRAFGTTGDVQILMEVWLQIERIWLARQRRAADVLAVKEELDHQIRRCR